MESKKLELKIKGMHCASCEIFIERAFRKVKGVEKANVIRSASKAEIYYSEMPDLGELDSSIREKGYSILKTESAETERPDYAKILLFALIVTGTYFLLKAMNIFPAIGISENMSYGFIFLIGLVAAFSTCLAVAGGLLLAFVSKYNEGRENMSRWQRFRPNIYFNIGRIASYVLFGALIGALGSIIALSTTINGYLVIFASVVMILLGFQLLKVFPWLAALQPRMPKIFSHKIHDKASSENHWAAPFFLGAGTFFLPCGFTVALQLYVLSKGSALIGALTMLAFSLGTLPSLVSIGAITSYVKGQILGNFMKFAGVTVIFLGIFNMANGLTLAGISFSDSDSEDIDESQAEFSSGNPFINQYFTESKKPAQKAEIAGGKQIARMRIVDLKYEPSKFVVEKGIPVEWQIDASQAQGCAQVISAPKLGVLKYLSSSKQNVIEFTPRSSGKISFSCTMGMTTPAYFKVV